MFESNLVKLKFNAFKIKLKVINFLTFFLTFNVLTSYYPTLGIATLFILLLSNISLSTKILSLTSGVRIIRFCMITQILYDNKYF